MWIPLRYSTSMWSWTWQDHQVGLRNVVSIWYECMRTVLYRHTSNNCVGKLVIADTTAVISPISLYNIQSNLPTAIRTIPHGKLPNTFGCGALLVVDHILEYKIAITCEHAGPDGMESLWWWCIGHPESRRELQFSISQSMHINRGITDAGELCTLGTQCQVVKVRHRKGERKESSKKQYRKHVEMCPPTCVLLNASCLLVMSAQL